MTSRVAAERARANNALVHHYVGSVDALRRAAVTHALERELEGPSRIRMFRDPLTARLAEDQAAGRLRADTDAAAALAAALRPPGPPPRGFRRRHRRTRRRR